MYISRKDHMRISTRKRLHLLARTLAPVYLQARIPAFIAKIYNFGKK